MTEDRNDDQASGTSAIGDSPQTQSGTMLETPAYLAPEQAGGKRGAVGPATDAGRTRREL